MRRFFGSAVALLVAVLAPSGTAAAASPAPFGHPCTTQPDGTRFCPTTDGGPGQTVNGVPSFDGVPLDVDVTLPPASRGDGPFPTIVMLHGYGNDKTSFESASPEGDGSITYHYNNDFYARQGFAVVNYTARGFGHSCGGGPAGYHVGPCGPGYIRLADTRYEARDTQFLLGSLVDRGLARAGALGVTGISYGGGQSLELAYLRDRIRLSDGSFAPWTSPLGTPLSITAAWPRWPWSDLVDSLLPNGRFLDTQVAPTGQSLDPVGIEIQSYVAGLYASGKATGYYCGDPLSTSFPCTNSDADLTRDFGLVNAGEPYTPSAQSILAEIYAHHQAYGLPGVPSPLLIENGWTDDLFPPEQAIRIYNQVRGSTPVSLQFGDLGHSRGSNKPTVNRAFNDQGAGFFSAYLTGTGQSPAPGSVTAYTQTCPQSAPDGGPYSAPSYQSLHHGFVRFGSPAAQLVTSSGDPTTSAAFDPITGTSDACKQVTAQMPPGNAVYEQASRGFTLLGLPTVSARIATVGVFGELDSQLFDVSPNGQERLISRGAYRLTDNQSGRVVFQLHGNGYYFPPGDTVKLVLLGSDAPYLRKSNDPAVTVRVSDLSVRLPTAEAGSGGGAGSGGANGGGDGAGQSTG